MSAWDRAIPAIIFAILAGVSLAGAAGRWQQRPSGVGPGLELTVWPDVANAVLAALFYSLIAWLFLIRSSRRGPPVSGQARAVALGGTFLLVPVGSLPLTADDWRILLLSDVVMGGGLVFATCAALSLGRSFGLTPEARGLVRTGPYRLVRHPIYLGELVAASGLVIPTLAPITAVLWGAYVGCQVTRAWLEERALTNAFPAYETYRKRTPFLLPWRLQTGG
jgi:protein-S-isoprenylcysteine O-methyltransferase Ste14